MPIRSQTSTLVPRRWLTKIKLSAAIRRWSRSHRRNRSPAPCAPPATPGPNGSASLRGCIATYACRIGDPAMRQLDDGLADVHDQVALVSRNDHGGANLLELFEQTHDVPRQFRVEISGRLVGQQ